MGIYNQPNEWECGPFALKHALLVHGILASEREIGRLAGTGPEGTDEAQLERAARHYGCELPTIRKSEPDEARGDLTTFLQRGIPCLLCVDEWDHWVTAVREEKERFIVLDSKRTEVIEILDWARLRRTWVYHDDDGDGDRGSVTLYDLHPVIARFSTRNRAHFSLERARHLLRPENQTLARLWDVYVEDLIALCRSGEPGGGRLSSLGEFLRRHTNLLLDELEVWHGRIEREAAARVLDRMRFVADTYGFVVRQRDERRTVAAIAMILALWAAGEFGIEPLYRKVPARKLR